MKKLILFLAFFAATGLTMQAQTCSKSKTASAKANCAATCSKAKAQKTTAVKASLEEAIVAAEADESIEKKVCSKSGAVSFAKKSVCSASGKVSFETVEYDAESKAFVNVSPSAMYDDEKADTAVKASMDAKSATKAKKSCDPAACKGKKAEKTDKT